MERNEDAPTPKRKFSRTETIFFFAWFAGVISWGLYQIFFN